jgi:hypothetical protein
MKKYFVILFLSLISVFTVFAQEDDGNDNNEQANKLQQKMKDYVQKRLGLSKAEAGKFTPVFLRYIVELRKTHRENRADKPMLQMKVGELKIRYRAEFRQIMDEQRANKVYEYQREFEIKILDEIKERRQERRQGKLPVSGGSKFLVQ